MKHIKLFTVFFFFYKEKTISFCTLPLYYRSMYMMTIETLSRYAPCKLVSVEVFKRNLHGSQFSHFHNIEGKQNHVTLCCSAVSFFFSLFLSLSLSSHIFSPSLIPSSSHSYIYYRLPSETSKTSKSLFFSKRASLFHENYS